MLCSTRTSVSAHSIPKSTGTQTGPFWTAMMAPKLTIHSSRQRRRSRGRSIGRGDLDELDLGQLIGQQHVVELADFPVAVGILEVVVGQVVEALALAADVLAKLAQRRSPGRADREHLLAVLVGDLEIIGVLGVAAGFVDDRHGAPRAAVGR